MRSERLGPPVRPVRFNQGGQCCACSKTSLHLNPKCPDTPLHPQVGADATVGTLKALVAAEMGVPASQQVGMDVYMGTCPPHRFIDPSTHPHPKPTTPPKQNQALLKDGQPLPSDDAPLSACGVGDNDFLFLMRGAAVRSKCPSSPASPNPIWPTDPKTPSTPRPHPCAGRRRG